MGSEKPKLALASLQDSLLYRQIAPDSYEHFFLKHIDGAATYPKRFLRYEFSLEKLLQNAINIMDSSYAHDRNLIAFINDLDAGISIYMSNYLSDDWVLDPATEMYELSIETLEANPLPIDNPIIASLFDKVQEEPVVSPNKDSLRRMTIFMTYYFMNMVHDLKQEAIRSAEIMFEVAQELCIDYLDDLLDGVFDYPEALQAR